MSNDTLYTPILPSKNKYICCCFSEQWFFQHHGLSAPKEYGKNDCLCFTCLDCCSWCLEFKQQRFFLCKERTFCFLCCITFIFE